MQAKYLSALLTASIAWAVSADRVHAQYGCYGGYGGSGVQQVLAKLDDNGNVVVRQFYYGFPPPMAPKDAPTKKTQASLISAQPQPPKLVQPIMRKMFETRLVFDAKRMHVTGRDGKPIDDAAWQKALGNETAVLFLGRDPGFVKGKETKPPAVPAHLPEIYSKGTLVIYSKAPPLEPPTTKEAGEGAPKHQAPQIMQVSYRDKVLHFREPFSMAYLTKIALAKTVDGKQVYYEIEVKHRSEGTNSHELPADAFTMLDARGKPVAAERVPEWLTKERWVLRSNSGPTIDPFYLQLIRPDSLILTLPAPPPPIAAPPPVEAN